MMTAIRTWFAEWFTTETPEWIEEIGVRNHHEET
jgi:hypothetical protein